MNEKEFAAEAQREADRLYNLFHPGDPNELTVVTIDAKERAFGGIVIGLGLAGLLGWIVAYLSVR